MNALYSSGLVTCSIRSLPKIPLSQLFPDRDRNRFENRSDFWIPFLTYGMFYTMTAQLLNAWVGVDVIYRRASMSCSAARAMSCGRKKDSNKPLIDVSLSFGESLTVSPMILGKPLGSTVKFPLNIKL